MSVFKEHMAGTVEIPLFHGYELDAGAMDTGQGLLV